MEKKCFLALQVLKAVPSLSSGMLSSLLEEGESEEPPNKQLEGVLLRKRVVFVLTVCSGKEET